MTLFEFQRKKSKLIFSLKKVPRSYADYIHLFFSLIFMNMIIVIFVSYILFLYHHFFSLLLSFKGTLFHF